jgi:DNA polymerase-3 subunit delta'
MDIIWLDEFAKAWQERIRSGRMPHAVLLAGPPGVGKRAAAAWIARGRLGIGEQRPLPGFPVDRPEHADLQWLEPAEDRQGILIDQVRELVTNLQLTSYEGRGKVAVIEPANTMTTSAANSLLKTLEEPPGDTLLILVADRTGRLPATVFSRCQRIEFAPPAESVGLAWLDRLQPGARWAEALRMAGNAPLAAIEALESLDTLATMSRELAAVGAGRQSPLEVAERWSKLEAGFVLDWLARQLRQGALALAGGRDRAPGLTIDESVLKRMDRRNLFCYLDTINRLRGQPRGSYNVQLALESLLIDWAEGLGDAGLDEQPGGMRLMPAPEVER